MSTTIYHNENPILENVELGAVYRIHILAPANPGPSTRRPTTAASTPLSRWRCPMGSARIRSRLAPLAMDARIAHATLEVVFVPIVDEEADTGSYALLHRFARPY